MKRILALILLIAVASCGRKDQPRLPVHEKPERPVALNARHRESSVILKWSSKDKPKSTSIADKGKPQAISDFVVQRADKGDYRDIAFVANATTYIDKSIDNGFSYSYRVAVKKGKSVGDFSETVTIFTSAPPAKPATPTFKIGLSAVTIQWKRAGASVFYNVYKGTQADTPLNPMPMDGDSFEDRAGLGLRSYYVLRAVTNSPSGVLNAISMDEGPPSDGVEVMREDFIPSKPTAFMALSVSSGVQLFWDESPEKWVKGYNIYRSANGTDYVKIGFTLTPAFAYKENITAETFYRVTAMGPAVEGPASAPFKLKPGDDEF